jgi:hypothetical protein
VNPESSASNASRITRDESGHEISIGGWSENDVVTRFLTTFITAQNVVCSRSREVGEAKKQTRPSRIGRMISP